jgi:hypothetical protein
MLIICMAQHEGHGLIKVKKYLFMSAAEGDLAVLQTALFNIYYFIGRNLK